MNYYLRRFRQLSVCLLLLSAQAATAQIKYPSHTVPIVINSEATSTIDYKAQSFNVAIMAVGSYTATSSADWLTVTKTTTGLTVAAAVNTSTERTATITISDGTNSQVLTYTQTENPVNNFLQYITVTSAEASSYNSDNENIAKSYDGNTSTIYHSNYYSNPLTVSATTPATLTYNFDATHLDYINYIPRTSGTNGNFGVVDIYYKTSGASDYTLFETYDFKKSSLPTQVALGSTGVDNVVSVKFVVKSGVGNYASCAEMQFIKAQGMDETSLFTDNTLTALKSTTTQTVIDGMTNTTLKDLAQRLLNGTYDATNRVSTHTCLLSPSALAATLNAPGKYYDQVQGVTGIVITQGKHLVAVSGIPDGKTVNLRVIGWKCPEGSTYYTLIPQHYYKLNFLST